MKGNIMKIILSFTRGKWLLFNENLIPLDINLVKFIEKQGIPIEYVR